MGFSYDENKTLLQLRGIFVRKAARIRSHVFLIMLAYMTAYALRRIWQDIEVTIQEGIEDLLLNQSFNW